MKIFKKAVSCILILTFLLSVFPISSFAEEAEGSDEYRISNDYLSFMFNQKTGGFAIETTEGNPHKVLDDNMPLLYSEDKERSNGTSFITVRIGDKDYVFGQDYGFFGLDSELGTIEVKENGRLIEIPWTIKGITVTLLAALDNNTESNTTGNVGLSFKVQNNSGKDENVSVRLLLDTALGNRIDAPYFVIDTNVQPTLTETEYSGENVPQQIRSVDSVTEPSRLSYILMQAEGWNGGTKPGKVILGHWANLANTRYDYTPDKYCDFSNYSNSYRTPDSAAAIYWENQLVKSGGTFNGELLYGVGNFSNTQSETTDIQITTERVELDTDKKSYKNNGEIKVTVNIDNTVDNAPMLSNAIVNLVVDDKQFEVISGDKQVQYVTLGKEIKTLQYTLRAIEQNDLCAGTIYVSLTGVKTLSDGTQADFETAEERSIILPSVGEVSAVQINKINPSTVYTDGEKAVTLSGKLKPLEAVLANDASVELKLIHETTGHSVTIKKNNIAFLDESGETLSFTTDEELHVGEYKVVFEINDDRLRENLKCDSISAAEKLEVSADEKYNLKSYGMAALVRTTEGSEVGSYDFFIFRTESEFLKFYKGESSSKGMLSGKTIKYNFGESREAIKNHEILVTVRANLYELKDESGNIFLQADYSSGDIIINNMLSYEGEKPLKLYRSGNKYVIEGDGLLKVIDSINVWRSKWSISATQGLAYTLDATRLAKVLDGDASICSLNLSLDGAATMIQSLGGFAVDLKYGEFSSQWYDDSDGMVTYGIGFGGSISLPIKAPTQKKETYTTDLGPAKEIDFTTDDEDLGESLRNLFDESLTADQEDISGDMTSLFDDTPEPQLNTYKITEETTLPEGSLTADVNNVLFGEKGKVEDGYVKVDDTGFIGIDATMSIELPEDLLGALVTNAPGVYASVTINTIKNQYELNAGLNIKIIECEGVLAFKQVNVKNKDVILPDKIEFYIRDGLKIPVAPPVLFIAGLGGGINGLADTIGGEFDKLPPITILLFTRLEAINVLAGDFNAKISLEGMSLTGDMKLNVKGLEKVMDLKAGISARWIEPWELNLYGNVSIIDGLIKGGITVTIADDYFYGYIFASICIPDSVPLVGGKELAGVEAAVSHEFIGANIKIIGIKFGVIYYWGENVSFGKNIDLSPPERKTNSLSLESAEDITAYYGTNIHELQTVTLTAEPLALSSEYKEATVYVENADGQDALLLEIPYSGAGTPDASEIKLVNPDGIEISAIYDDGNGGGNMILQSREDGNFIYITVTDKNAIKNGAWKVRYTTDNIEISTFAMNGVDTIPELAQDGTTITLDANDQKVKTGWKINGGDGSAIGTIDVYLTEDKDILSKIKASTNSGDVLGVNILHKENAALQSGAASETITLPDSLPNGKYYAVTTLSTTDGISLAISAQSIDFVNPNLPKMVSDVKIAYGGNGGIFVKVTDPEDADYTHYLAEIVAEDGTVLENHIGQFEKGENFVFGKEASLEPGKSYHVNIKTLREEYKKSDEEYKNHYYYGMDTVSSNSLILPESNLPELKEVKVNLDTTGEEINTNVDDVIIEYTFENDVFVEMKLNGNKIYSFDIDADPTSPDFSYFKKDWKFVLDDLEDGDYVVDFTAYTDTKDHIKGSETDIENAQLGFTVDTSAPVLSLAQKSIDRKLGDDDITVIFGANTVIADQNGNYVIEGITEKSAELMLDGVKITEDSEGVTIAPGGSFKIERALDAGELSKEHLITATDKAGNVSYMTVYAVRADGFSFERLALYLDGEEIAADTDGVKTINLKNGQSAQLSAYAVSDNGQKFAIENDMIDWSVLYAKNALEIKDGTVSALTPGETAVKAKLSTAGITTDSGTRSDGISDYVIINVFAYTKEDLIAEITKAKSNILVTGNASEDDITTYQAAIDTAQTVYDDSTASQTAVDSATEALKAATEAFDLKKNAATDKTALKAEIDSAELNIKTLGNASAEDAAVYQAAIDAAKSVYEDATALQAAVDSATEALKSATETFNQKKNSVDKTELAKEIEAAKENIANVNKAGKTDIEKYQSAIDEATAVYNKADATQSEIDNALAELVLATKTFNSKNNPSSSGGSGGGSSAKYYDVNVTTNDGGSASVSQTRVLSGNSVTITVVPEDGYEIESITVNGEYFGKAEKSTIAKITQNTDIVVTFAPKRTNPFIDVTGSDWFYDNVIWVYQNGLMNGISDNMFGPETDVTRAMMVTILYRAEGEPAVNNSIPFADVDVNAYYANAVAWAQQNGIVYGITENEFAPDDNITREQIAAIMFRYAKYKGYDVSVGENTNILSYTDAESVSEYAIASVQYAVGAGIMKGKSNTTLNPQDNATRAEIAAILQRFLEANE